MVTLRISALLFLVALMSLSVTLCATVRAETMRFINPPPEAAGDERHLDYWQLLDAALASNRDRYGAVV